MKGHVIFRLFVPAMLLAFNPLNLDAQCVSGNCQNGSGTYRYENGAKYSGQFSGGKPDGKGVMNYNAKSNYDGQWKNGQREGKGKMVYNNGDVYDGSFVRGKRNGKGSIVYNNGDKYTGEWANDQMKGRGTYTFKTKERYEGEFVSNRFEGEGTMYYPDGSYYKGSWKDNRKHGKGRLVTDDGTTAGVWEYGQLVNEVAGTQAASGKVNGSKPSSSKPSSSKPDVGSLRNCNTNFCRSGRGFYDYADGSRWIGDFKDGNPAGKGTCYYSNGDRYEGMWANNTPNGDGIMYFENGRVYGANWVNGSPVSELDSEEDVPSDPVKVENSSNVKIWAVIVGVGRYTAMPSLKFTDDDAYRFYTFLKSPEGGALNDDQIAILIDEDASRENILRTMRKYFLKADANDVVMFYFSGHGLEGCFLPVDFDGYNNKLRHEEIISVLKQSKAKHKICIADACHSGTLRYGLAAKGPTQVSLQRYYQAFEEADGGIALLMSSKGEELSLEDQGLRQGVFTYFVLQGMRGKADQNGDYLISIRELYNYVKSKVYDYTAGAQTPVLTGDYDNAMPVALRRF